MLLPPCLCQYTQVAHYLSPCLRDARARVAQSNMLLPPCLCQYAQVAHYLSLCLRDVRAQVAQSNMVLQRADMQRATLEAMMEVRRETLQKAFGSSSLARSSAKGARELGATQEEDSSSDSWEGGGHGASVPAKAGGFLSSKPSADRGAPAAAAPGLPRR